MLKHVVAIIFIVLIPTNRSTLSKSDKKKPQAIKKEYTLKSLEERNLLDNELNIRSILSEGNKYCKTPKCLQKIFKNDVLGYITPWNANGYKYSTLFYQKFTYLSPVWFSVKPKCSIQKNINLDWFLEIKNKTGKTNLKIVPRFMFEQWENQNILEDLNSQNLETCISIILDYMNLNYDGKNYEFEGLVLDNFYMLTKHIIDVRHKFLKLMSEKLHKTGKILILVLPPPFYKDDQQLIKREELESLTFVDRFSLNTYDYSLNLNSIGPNSPLDWLKSCIVNISDEASEIRRKLFLGINFYGYDYNLAKILKSETTKNTDSSQFYTPVTGVDYYNILEKSSPDCRWNEEWKEHFCQHQDNGEMRALFYPSVYTLKLRLELAEELGVGIAIWELGQGLSSFFNLF